MKNVKRILIMAGLLGLLAMAAAPTDAKAQTFSYTYPTLTIPTVTAGASSNAIGVLIDCRRQQNLALSWTTGCTNVLVRIGASIDGANWNTNYFVWGFTNALPATTVTTITNLNPLGVGYLRIDSVTSTGTIGATNTVNYGLSYGAK